MAHTNRRVVSFELSEVVFKALQDDAAIRGSGSIHQRARDIVVDYFANREIDELNEQITSLDANVAYLGDLVRRVAYSVIVHAAGKGSEEANRWIREHMPKTGPS
jgi:hypothetical protein